MKYKATIILLLLSASLSAGQLFDNLKEFRTGVRTQTATNSTAFVSDSVLFELCSRAIVYTSVDIGGVEQTFKVNMVAGQPFYQVPDSIVEVMYATFLATDETRSIKAFPPQFVQDAFDLTVLDSTNSDAKPVAFNIWADSMQIIPSPAQVDSVYLKCFVRHAAFELADSASAISLDDAYQEAALFYCCFLVQDRMTNYQKADRYLAIYEKMRETLRSRHARKIDILRTGQ